MIVRKSVIVDVVSSSLTTVDTLLGTRYSWLPPIGARVVVLFEYSACTVPKVETHASKIEDVNFILNGFKGMTKLGSEVSFIRG